MTDWITQSESIAKLAEALSKAQGEMTGVPKSALNPHFNKKYADLESALSCARAPLSKHGLSIVQIFIPQENILFLKSMLLHSSGEFICSYYPVVPTKLDPQGYGSAATYARRYCVMALVGIAPEDDDGNAASDDSSQQSAPKTPAWASKEHVAPKPAIPPPPPIYTGSPMQQDRLRKLLITVFHVSEEHIYKVLGNMSDLCIGKPESEVKRIVQTAFNAEKEKETSV